MPFVRKQPFKSRTIQALCARVHSPDSYLRRRSLAGERHPAISSAPRVHTSPLRHPIAVGER